MMIAFWVFAGIVALFLLTALRGAPYVPSRRQDIDRAFTELYHISKEDHLVDLGSGDGIVLRQAAKKGASASGFEINPVLVLVSKLLCRKYTTISVRQADFWRSKLPPDTTVVYVFGEGRDIDAMGDWIVKQAQIIGKPLFVISYGFEFKRYEPIKKVGAQVLYRLG
jgi:hypothetical protein